MAFARLLEKLAKGHAIKRNSWDKLLVILAELLPRLKADDNPGQVRRRLTKAVLYSMYCIEKNRQTEPASQSLLEWLYGRLAFLLQIQTPPEEWVKELKALVYLSSCLMSVLPVMFAPRL